MMSTSIRALAVLLACLALVACGKKVWPRPIASQDRFSFTDVKSERRDGCLMVRANLKGGYANLTVLRFQIQALGSGPGEGCPGCPFSPTRVQEFTPGSAGLVREGSSLQVTVCGLDPSKTYRFVLVGENAFPVLGAASTDMVEVDPETGK